MAEVTAPPQAETPLPASATSAPAAPAKAPEKPVARRFELPPEKAADAPAPAASEPEKPAQNTGDEATPADPEGEKPEVVTPEQEAKRAGRRFERKLDKAYRQRAEAEARASLLEQQLAAARQQQAPKKADGEPTLEQYDYDPEKYAQAKAEHAKKTAAQELTAKQRQEAVQQDRQRLQTAWDEKVERGLDKYEDFEKVVGELQPNTPFVAAIMEAENGEDVAHYLGKNPKEAERIAKLPPLSQIREIGKLEAKLLSEPVKPKAPSKAPAPIAPLTGAAPVVSDEPSESDDMKAWMRKRQKQVHGKR